MSSEGPPAGPVQAGSPSRLWWVAHVFCWVISGLVCYLVWKDRNREAARRHLVHSLWIPIAANAVFMAAAMLAFPAEWHKWWP